MRFYDEDGKTHKNIGLAFLSNVRIKKDKLLKRTTPNEEFNKTSADDPIDNDLSADDCSKIVIDYNDKSLSLMDKYGNTIIKCPIDELLVNRLREKDGGSNIESRWGIVELKPMKNFEDVNDRMTVLVDKYIKCQKINDEIPTMVIEEDLINNISVELADILDPIIQDNVATLRFGGFDLLKNIIYESLQKLSVSPKK